MTTPPAPAGAPSCAEHPRRRRVGCRACDTVNAWRRREDRRRDAAAAWRGYHPAAVVSAYIGRLRTAGLSIADVVARSGIPEGTVRGVYTQAHTRVNPRAATAILAVPLPDTPPGPDTVDATGTRRRVQAMTRDGFSAAAQATRLGWSPPTVAGWCTAETVSIEARDAVVVLYDKLADQVGPAWFVAARARERGHMPRHAWRGDEIDDPAVDPHEKLPPELTRRKLRACAAMAWAPHDIAAEYDGIDAADLGRIMRQGQAKTRVPRWVHNTVATFYDTYAHRAGPSPALRAEARGNRWATAWAWGDHVDDLTARGGADADPDEPISAYSVPGIELAIGGHIGRAGLNDVETVYVVTVLRRYGFTTAEITAHLRWPGRDPDGVLRVFMSPGRRPELPPELVARLALAGVPVADTPNSTPVLTK